MHKAYLFVDLPLPPLGAELVASLVTVRQSPGDVTAAWRPLPPFHINEFEYGPAVSPGPVLHLPV